MELIDLVPSSLSFRVITTVDVDDESEVPTGYTGRVRRHSNGSVSYVAWYRDGQLHNPGRHHPAYRRFRPDGRLKYELFYTHGLLHDPGADPPSIAPRSGPARRRQDGRDGTAAIRKWRNDGSIRHELRYQDGKRILDDGPA